MKLETIKKSKKKNILVGGLIILSLVSVVTYTTTRAKYKSVQSVRLANGSVNFKGADMSLVAINVSEDGTNYSSSTTLPEGIYRLNATRSKCRIPTETLIGENAPEDQNARIEYKNRELTFAGITTKNTKCYVYLDKVIGSTSTSIVTAITNSSMYKGEKTTGFGTIATGSEKSTTDANSGIFSAPDPMYKTTDNQNPVTYYWRGTGETNHVVFAGKCWRIIRINGDKSIRIIYNGIANGNSCANRTDDQKKNVLMADWNAGIGYYYATSDGQVNNKSYVGWTYIKDTQRTLAGTDSHAKKLTEDWFNDNANFTTDQREQVAIGYFCNDRNVGQPYTGWNWGAGSYVTSWQNNTTRFAYAAEDRVYNQYKPVLTCNSGDTYRLKAGAITADEAQFAGGKRENNTLYYLYAGKNYWTMSPSEWYSGTQAVVFEVNASGYLDWGYVSSTARGLRPVINLDSNSVIFEAGGTGTESNPYVVIE